MPDTGAYDRQFDAQVDLMKMQQTGAIQCKAGELDKVLRNQTAALAEIKDAKVERANEVASVEAEARRMSNLIGTPPPEPTASAPVIGRDREKGVHFSKGKRSAHHSKHHSHDKWVWRWPEHQHQLIEPCVSEDPPPRSNRQRLSTSGRQRTRSRSRRRSLSSTRTDGAQQEQFTPALQAAD